jgi:hypothetical protein
MRLTNPLYTSALPFFGPVPSILVAASGFVLALTSALTLTLAPGVEVAVLLLTAVPDLVFCDWARNFCDNKARTTLLVSDVNSKQIRACTAVYKSSTACIPHMTTRVRT